MSAQRTSAYAVLALLVPSLAWASVPVEMAEPSTTILLGAGLSALVLRKLRRR